MNPASLGSPMPQQYWGSQAYFGGNPPLPVGAGYAIVIGFGAFLSIFTSGIVWVDQWVNRTPQTSEYFNTAGRDVRTGLTAAVICSQWTWAATLLQSSNVAWSYGVSGPFWYASGATIQVLLFGILAIEVKRKARTAHTFCEMVLARWGKAAHITFIFFGLLTNIIVTSMLLLGGAAVVNALTGMNIALASFLIPWGVILYSAVGGLRAKFLADYIHVVFIFVILMIFIYTVYVKVLSTDIVYDGLTTVSSFSFGQCQGIFSSNGNSFFKAGQYACGAVDGNRGGSYLTMISSGGTIFGIINIVGNFGTVFVDQSYWQSAIAAKPASAHKGYLMGGLCWFTIPFSLATSLGLACVAFQLPISADEANAGLVPPAIATHLFGPGGAVAITIMLFMAITSCGSGECLAVSSIFAYDVWKVYVRPQASGNEILIVSKVVVIIFGAAMGGLSVGLEAIGISLGWVYLFMGIVIGSAVMPLWYLLMWKQANAVGAVAAAWFGMLLAVATWLIVAKAMYGEVTVKSLGNNEPMLAGNVVALAAGALIHTVLSLIWPQNYDFKSMGEIAMLENDTRGLDPEDYADEKLDEALSWIQRWGWGFTITMVVLWPVLSTPAGVFDHGYFAMWVFISLAWGFIAAFAIIFLPLHESMADFRHVAFTLTGLKVFEPQKELSQSADVVVEDATKPQSEVNGPEELTSKIAASEAPVDIAV